MASAIGSQSECHWTLAPVYAAQDFAFDLIYVNGDNNLKHLKTPDESRKVRVIEKDFCRLMFDTEGV